ncbi:MAG: phytanoyl-CoA dioxygenase family protein [Bryobacteraceae bacterium]
MPRVFTSADLDFFEESGYVILHDAAPPDMLQAAIAATWEFMEMDPNDPATWYRPPARLNGMPELNGAGMVEMYHHPSLWAIRQLPRIHGAFADLWDTEHLWVTIDRVNLNVPNRPGQEFRGFIHWDIDTTLDPLPFDLQGVLSLTDAPAGHGGFQCVPGMPKRFAEWVKTQPVDRHPHRPDLTGLEVRRVEMRAGDLVIWNSQLAHGTSPNTSQSARLAMYLSMSPAQESNETARQWRVQSWLHRIAPEGNPFPGDPRGWERKHGVTAALTPLGRRLLGLDLWSENGAGAQLEADMRLDQRTGRRRATPGFAS